MSQEIVNTSESRCSFKIESNSRGNNYTTHIYGQCSQEEINDCIAKTIEAHNQIQKQANGDKTMIRLGLNEGKTIIYYGEWAPQGQGNVVRKLMCVLLFNIVNYYIKR